MYKAQVSIRAEYPKNFKGFKIQTVYQEFGTPKIQNYPPKMKEHIAHVEKKNQDYFSRPSNYGKTHLDFQLGPFFIFRPPQTAVLQRTVPHDKPRKCQDVRF